MSKWSAEPAAIHDRRGSDAGLLGERPGARLCCVVAAARLDAADDTARGDVPQGIEMAEAGTKAYPKP